MSDNDKFLEKSLKDYPDVITLQKTEKIVEQIKNSIFKIHISDGGNGTGFFCNIHNIKTKQTMTVMITNNHIIGQEYLYSNKSIKISFNNEEKIMDIKLDSSRKKYTNKQYDITIIEIKKSDKINKNSFLEIDDKIYQDNPFDFFTKKSVYILQYPNYHGASVSYGLIKQINQENELFHLCTTDKGSSGSPIINLENSKVIGIHKGGSESFNFNRGIFLKAPINDFFSININYSCNFSSKVNKMLNDENEEDNLNKNEIEITLRIDKNDIGKEIFFLDNTNEYVDNNKKPHFNLTELNPSNTDLYINNQKLKYQKFFIPKFEGKYEINLKFQNYLKNCSYMFYYCKNIIDINFKYFKTDNITNMSKMFCYCSNLTALDLSSFKTENVTNMSNMFSYCSNLKKINLSSFNVKNITNMEGMFSLCNKLEYIDISSFIVSPNIKTHCIFDRCRNLKVLKINKKSKAVFDRDTQGIDNIQYI